MIAKVTKGSDVGGLLRYLFGPGEHNEHRDQHVVAGYTGEAAMMEPPRAGDRVDVRPLTADLIAPIDLAQAHGRRIPDKFVWHCSLSLRADEGQLSDQRWREICEAFTAEMGFAGDPAADVAGCHWVAVRHGLSKAGNDHVHLVVTLATEEGGRVSVHRDYRRAQHAVHRLEERFGLRQIAVRDRRTGRPGLTRAELDRAGRHGDTVADRTWLRGQVRAAAAGAATETAFVAQLRARGVLVHARTDAADPSRVTGYAVARDHPGRDVVYYGGGSKLDGQLSLPRLRRRWPGTEATAETWQTTPPAAPAAVTGGSWTLRTAANRVEQIAKSARVPYLHGGDAGLLTDRATRLLTRLADAAEPGQHATLADAADHLDRAAAPPRRPLPRPSRAGRDLARDLAGIARLIATTGRPRTRDQLAAVITLIAAAVRLTTAIAQLHEATGRRAAAGAALTAQAQLTTLLAATANKGLNTATAPRTYADRSPAHRPVVRHRDHRGRG